MEDVPDEDVLTLIMEEIAAFAEREQRKQEKGFHLSGSGHRKRRLTLPTLIPITFTNLLHRIKPLLC